MRKLTWSKCIIDIPTLFILLIHSFVIGVFNNFSFLGRTSNREFLLLFFCVVAIVISNRYVSPTLLQFLCLDSELISYCLFRNVFISRLSDRVIRLQHVVHRLLGANQTSNLTLCQLEVRTQTVINNLVSLVN